MSIQITKCKENDHDSFITDKKQYILMKNNIFIKIKKFHEF